MQKFLILLFISMGLLCSSASLAGNNIYSTGTSFHGIRDFREVLSGVLYRGGANNGRNPLNSSQLSALCENGMGSAVYLYSAGFGGPSDMRCSGNETSYQYKSWQGAGLKEVHNMIYETIKTNGKPVFVHCWYGIHATGLVAATSLMQFCNATADQAVTYWKIGIPPALQYQNVIDKIRSFKPDPRLQLSTGEQNRVCPQL